MIMLSLKKKHINFVFCLSFPIPSDFIPHLSHTIRFYSVPLSYHQILFRTNLIPSDFIAYLSHTIRFYCVPISYHQILLRTYLIPSDFIAYLSHTIRFYSVTLSYHQILFRNSLIPSDFILNHTLFAKPVFNQFNRFFQIRTRAHVKLFLKIKTYQNIPTVNNFIRD